jgi:hypothetical protein
MLKVDADHEYNKQGEEGGAKSDDLGIGTQDSVT